MDYRFYTPNQQYPNYNTICGILPKDRLIIDDITKAIKFKSVLVIIDISIHDYGLKSLKKILKLRKSKQLDTKIIIDYAYESGCSKDIYLKKIKRYAKYGITQSEILTIFNTSASHNPWIQEYKKYLHFIDLFAVSSLKRYENKTPVSTKLLRDRTQRANVLIGKTFLPSRTKIIEAFYRSSVKINSIFSFIGSIKTTDISLREWVDGNAGPIDGSEVHSITIGGTVSTQGYGTSSIIYDTSTVSYVHETHELGMPYFITEKTWRPILNKTAFVIRAPFPAIQHLQQLGFRTFGNFIDETYDNYHDITDDYSNQLVSYVKHLVEHIEKTPDVFQEIVDHNFNRLLKYAKSENKKLTNRIDVLINTQNRK